MKTTTLDPGAGQPVLAALAARLDALELVDEQWQAAAERGLAVAQIVASLDAEQDMVAGALLHPLLKGGLLDAEAAGKAFGEGATRFAVQLGQLGEFRIGSSWAPDRPLSAGQAETLRKMLLAVVSDPRLVLVRLAEQLHLMRNARELADAHRLRVAWETREIYAPLANRLGIWQLKWELEDLAFRYLEPEEYRRIATQLSERRADRERQIDEAQREITEELERAGVRAEITGRPKHIYSIWKKMRRKELPFEQVFDVRAVRILTDTIADCYAALGAVHGRWRYIPGEFDDYIATPKDNLYRSLHTAVIGPGAVPLEVQIRTHEMHAHAELGVAAHWRYKEGRSSDSAYDRKIEWLRELLTPAADGESEGDFLERVRADLFEDRVYVLTPKGEIVDLPAGSTPLDFAYHVHTGLGHRCRGARINGRIVPLDYRLSNGEVVDIIGGKQAQPSRDWLIEQQGYLASPRSRAKVRAWFKRQDEGQNLQEGRQLLDAELSRLGMQQAPSLPDLIAEFGLASAEGLYLALGAGDLTLAQVTGAIQRRLRDREAAEPVAVRRRPAGPSAKPAAQVHGIADLLSTYARCCNPVPPEPITGYVTVGRGVTVHRSDCSNLKRLEARAPERLLEVSWGGPGEMRFPVEIAIHAIDQRGLVRDISSLLADEKISIERMVTTTSAGDGTADISLRIPVSGLPELSRLLSRIAALPNVVSARRRR